MPQIIHFRGSDEIIKAKNMEFDVNMTLEYLQVTLQGALYKRELTNQALAEYGWRNEDLSILEGRRYQYKGLKNDIAIEGNFSSYEYILEGLFRLQIGFDKARIEAGILMLPGQRSENSKLGTSLELAKAEIEQLSPTILLPVTIALFDLGSPEIVDSKEGGEDDGFSISTDREETDSEDAFRFDDPFP